MSGYYLGIDAGGTMTKVALFDRSGKQLAVEVSPNVMLIPNPGWTERDADKMWSATCESIRKMLARPNISADQILGIAPTGFGGGAFFIDENGDPTRNAVVSTDSRGLDLIEAWDADGTGSSLRRTLKQLNWGGQTLVLLAWLEANMPNIAAKTRYVLSCKDFIRYRLCGDISTDATDASCSGFYDLSKGAVSELAFQYTGLTAWLEKIPAIGKSAETVGGVSSVAAAETGLREGTPVVRGVYDVVGCALATGVTNSEQLAVVAGTFAIHSTLHSTPCGDPLPTIQTPYLVDELSIATMAKPTSASNLEWLKTTMISGLEAEAKVAGKSVYELANEMVENTLSEPNQLIFLPFIYGGPGGMPAGFFGLTPSVGMAEILRAVYEGVVFAHRTDMEHLLGGSQSAKPKVIRLAGGAARSDVWAQMFSDGLGLPVEIADGEELGGKGAAICTAVALGHYPDTKTAIANMVKVNRLFSPNQERVAELSTKFAIYKRAVDIAGKIPFGSANA